MSDFSLSILQYLGSEVGYIKLTYTKVPCLGLKLGFELNIVTGSESSLYILKIWKIFVNEFSSNSLSTLITVKLTEGSSWF